MNRAPDGDLPPPSTDLEIRLTREVLLLRDENAVLRARLERLEERLNRHSGNSNQPPSSDGPGAPPREKKKGSGKKPGGQPGHPRRQRVLVPTEQADKVQSVNPAACDGCGEKDLLPTGLKPLRHQVWDLPEWIRPFITEYQLQAMACPCCRMTTRAKMPEGVPVGNFGPRVQGWVTYLSSKMRLSDRQIQELLKAAFGLEISVGMIAKLRAKASDSVAAPVAAAREHVATQPVVNADETGWKERAKKCWLWVAVTSLVSVFLIQRGRDTEAAKTLLGRSFVGTLGSDRLGSYDWVSNWQACWSHLLRGFAKIAGRRAKPGRIGRRLQRLGKKVFKAWHRFKDQGHTRATLHRSIRLLRTRVERALRDGATCGDVDTQNECRDLLAEQQWFWTFAYVEGVEPTNNVSEQSLRQAVMWRKIRTGTQSNWGSRYVERMLTVVATMKQQGRNALEYFIAAAQAQLNDQPAPSLLPA
jgi:transposase